jgi:putative phage-type endonuclease
MSTMDRTRFIGGSDVAAILGVSPWKSPFRLYQEKTGAYVEEITLAKQRIFDRGHRWEPVVVEMLIDELQDRGHDVQIIARNARYLDRDFPYLACELDLELRIDGEEHNAEIKTVHPFAAKDWGEQDTDEIPIYYAAQVMHGLMVKPRRRSIVAALIGVDDLRVHQIERDEETIAAIRAKEVEFWRRVQERDAPPPETSDDVKWLYAKDCGIVMEADDDLQAQVTHLAGLKAEAKRIESAAEAAATRIKCAMGHASTLIYQGRKIASWKSNKESTKTDWQQAFEILQKSVGANADEIVCAIRKSTKTVAGARPLLIK